VSAERRHGRRLEAGTYPANDQLHYAEPVEAAGESVRRPGTAEYGRQMCGSAGDDVQLEAGVAVRPIEGNVLKTSREESRSASSG
jgi:hypothetical protein